MRLCFVYHVLSHFYVWKFKIYTPTLICNVLVRKSRKEICKHLNIIAQTKISRRPNTKLHPIVVKNLCTGRALLCKMICASLPCIWPWLAPPLPEVVSAVSRRFVKSLQFRKRCLWKTKHSLRQPHLLYIEMWKKKKNKSRNKLNRII